MHKTSPEAPVKRKIAKKSHSAKKRRSFLFTQEKLMKNSYQSHWVKNIQRNDLFLTRRFLLLFIQGYSFFWSSRMKKRLGLSLSQW